MEYSEFICFLKAFKVKAAKLLATESYDYTEMIFETDYRRIFLNYDLKTTKTKLSIEVRAMIPENETNHGNQAFFTKQLQNMIELCNYLLELQSNYFTIDSLPEEGIWYATIELENTQFTKEHFALLKTEEKKI